MIKPGDCVIYRLGYAHEGMLSGQTLRRGLVLSVERGFDILDLNARGWGSYALQFGISRKNVISKTNCRRTELQWASQQLPRLIKSTDQNEWLIALDMAHEKISGRRRKHRSSGEPDDE